MKNISEYKPKDLPDYLIDAWAADLLASMMNKEIRDAFENYFYDLSTAKYTVEDSLILYINWFNKNIWSQIK